VEYSYLFSTVQIRPRNARVIVENKVTYFLGYGVVHRDVNETKALRARSLEIGLETCRNRPAVAVRARGQGQANAGRARGFEYSVGIMEEL